MAHTEQEIKKLCKGRTREQQAVIRYFLAGGGCLSSSISDEDYESKVMTKVNQLDSKKRALQKIGLDETEVNEIEPVHFENYFFDVKTTYAKWGKDRKWRSSAYQISWIFFSSSQLYIYQYTFHMDNDEKKEKTEEYFYKDVTSFSSTSETVEKEVLDKVSCNGQATYSIKNVHNDLFAIVVPGDKFFCSMTQSDYSERAIQGMKAKLREKKV
ncbi:MAG: hypothetical protein A2161_04655 [Candidatus Schekmanbacteria bacterium RBG_13_48_7]|uniref:Uncharacterized protein n=1 Tax=Candidatus Schekmanbacteria bacterium RBG_13_48_7 TaxID=1817878 RepID=A0A1F7RNT4_9BACT|nr:MAG: hypothetical protein A2161_04655 [Candidatus Schekmanbacteria bacterium RBG_13_48_7]